MAGRESTSNPAAVPVARRGGARDQRRDTEVLRVEEVARGVRILCVRLPGGTGERVHRVVPGNR